MKTYTAKPETVQRDWFVVDAAGQTLGRLADRLELRYIRERRLAKDFLLTMDMELLSERQLLSVTM